MMTSSEHWVVEAMTPSTPGAFTDDDLDPIEPLWRSLMDRHREVWDLIAMRDHEDSWRRRRAQYREWLAAPGSFVLVARRGSRLLAYAVVGIQDGDETYATGERQAEIHTLAVLPDERERGIGSSLMDEIERRLPACGVADVFVATMHGNDGASRFYERRGYAPFVHVSHRRLG